MSASATRSSEPAQSGPSPHAYNGFNQLLSVSGAAGGLTSFTYDGNGNQVTRTDAAGTTTYAYNLDNRLIGIAAPGGVSTFEYDANGLRTKKSDSTGTRSYLLDGLSVVAEYAPDASRLAWYTQSLARIDEVLNVVNSQGKYWYETDALGSTYAMTNASGTVVSRSSYDVFGERALVSANAVAQPFGFTGREQDPGGLVYARARYLNAIHGQWMQPDPVRTQVSWIRSDAYPVNAFAALDAAPTQRTDPQGRFTSLALARVAGLTAGLAFMTAGAMWLYYAYQNYLWNDPWEDQFEYGMGMFIGGIEIALASLLPACGSSIKRAANAMDRNGLTYAGRALQKHGVIQGRRGASGFVVTSRKAAELNSAGLRYVGDILASPSTARTFRFWKREGTFVIDYVDDVASIGFRIRWWDGSFVGFL